MMAKAQQKHTASSPDGAPARGKGLFRAALAGHGHSLPEAFANLERAANVERICRHPARQLLGARISLSPEEGQGYYELTRIRDEIFVLIENFAFKDPRVELVPGDGLVQFNFKLSGDLTLAVSRTQPLRFNQPSLLIWNQPRGLDIDEWTAPSAYEKCVCVSVRPEYLAEQFLDPADEVAPQLQAFVSGNSRQLNYCHVPLSSTEFDLAMKLVDNPFIGRTRLIYTEAVVQELLCHAVHGFSALTTPPNLQYTPRELRSLHAARNFLMQQFSPAPTIRQTARAAGMNETSLKQGFKAIFGETVFQFGVRCRMQHALVLIRDQGMPVARVAEAVGYRHQTSFTTAFVRHFGMRPKDVRPARNRRLQAGGTRGG